MSDFSGAIYQPPQPGLPIVAALFKNGEIIAFRAVASVKEAQDHIDEALLNLPLLVDEKDSPRA